MGLITYDVNSAETGVTQQNVENAASNLYWNSPSFRKVVDYIMGHPTNPEIAVVVDDTSLEPIMLKPSTYPGGAGAWPYGTANYAVIIPTTFFDGEEYTNSVDTFSVTFERLFAHEIKHVEQDLAYGPATPQNLAEREADASDFEDKVDHEGSRHTLEPHPDDLRQTYTNPIPGSGDDPHFHDTGSTDPIPALPPAGPTDAFFDAVRTIFQTARSVASPLVLDLDDSGTIELVSLANSDTYWDIDQDGFAELSGWVTGGDGLLALDVNDNGVIDDNGELFGTVDTDGFTILAAYDSNDDGLITEEDTIWEDLIVWVDANENGYSESGELYSMADLDIISVSLNATPVSQTNQGHDVTHTSTFTVDTGGGTDTRIVHDIWFEYDEGNTIFVGDYTLDSAVFDLPDLRGYGVLPPLYVANSLDNDDQDPDSLISLVTDFSELEIDDLFVDDGSVFDAVKDIMYRWAGVDGLTGDERGDYIDSRELGFLEAMMGQDYLQGGYNPNPYYWASQELKEGFYVAQQNIFARLAAQSAGGELFTGDWHYDIATDAFVGITGLDSGVLDDLETLAGSQSDKAEYWKGVVRMIEFAVGVDNLSGGDQTALDDAIYDSDNSLDLAQIEAAIEWDAPAGSTYNGTSGNDNLSGGTGNDGINGLAGDDTLNGGLGADTLSGGNNDDTMNGQSSDDIIYGGSGNDTYIYELGHGNDVYEETQFGAGNNADIIELGAGIDSGDVTITRVSNNDLLIEIDTGAVTGSILLQNHFNAAGLIETLEYNDTSTVNLVAQSYTLTGTADNDTLVGANTATSTGSDTIYGGAGNDEIYAYAPNETDYQANTLYGEDGNDTIYGGEGVDTIYGGSGDDYISANAGADDISMGSGNDTAYGGAGDDVYHYVSGHDVIYDSSGTDEIRLDAAWDSITPTYYKIGGDLKIVWDANNSILIQSFFGAGEVETMIYDDTTSVTLDTVSYIVQGDSGNNTLYGTSGVDTLYGFEGNDTLWGYDNNDILYGGTGNDSIGAGNGNDYVDGGAGNDDLRGDAGDDLYYFVSGVDYIWDTSGTDILELAAGWTWEDVTFRRYSTSVNDLVVEVGSPANAITLAYNFTSSQWVETLRVDGSGDITLASLQYESHGTSGNDSFSGITYGGSVNDIMYGFAGNDSMWGGSGNDELYGGDGNDSLYGESGDDYLDGGAGDDALSGGANNDHYFFGGGNDSIVDSGGGTDILEIDGAWALQDLTFRRYAADYNDLLIEIDGSNELFLDDQFYSSTYGVDTLRLDGISDIALTSIQVETHGTSGNDTIAGIVYNGSTNDIIYGFAGNDTIDGGNGNDTIHGGDGNDYMDGYHGDDLFVYTGGIDSVVDWSGTDTLWMTGGTTINDISVANDSTYHARITLNASVDEILVYWLRYPDSTYYTETIRFDDGFSADLPSYQSWMTGTSGNDTTNGNSSANVIIGKAGNDTIDALGGNDQVHGGTGDDSIEGGDGADLLHGGEDDDLLYGEDGLDTLFGGTGEDTFVFQAASAFNNIDEIKDFNTAQNDAIDIADLLTGYNPTTSAIEDFVSFVNDGANSKMYVDRDGTAGTYSSAQVALIHGVTNLDAEDLETGGYLIAA